MSINNSASLKNNRYAIFILLGCLLFIKNLCLSGLTAPVVKKHPMMTGKQSDPATQTYLNNLRQSLLKNWELIDGKNTVVLQGIVELDGNVAELRSTSASETNALAIDSAMNAMEKCKPLAPLPASYKHSCTLTLTFHSTVDPHGDSDSSLTTEMKELQGVLAPNNIQ
jgi:hypothetical protein